MKFNTRTVRTAEIEDVEIELEFEPCNWLDTHMCKIGERVIIAYNVLDDDYRNVDDLMGDCMGRIIDAYNGRDAEKHELYELAGCDRYGDKDLDAVWDRHEDAAVERYIKKVLTDYTIDELREEINDDEVVEPSEAEDHLRQDARGAHWGNVMYEKTMEAVLEEMWDEPAFWPGNPDAVMLDVYDHSGQAWSISGGGMQCRWDTSRGAGAWVPDKCLLEQIASDVAEGKDRRAQCRLYAEQFLNTYNEIISGNVYGCVVQVHDLEGAQLSEESCWGFIGTDHAEESLKDEFYNPAIEDAKKVWGQRLAELGITIQVSWYLVAWMNGTQREVMKFDDLDAAVEFAKEKQHEHV